MARPFHPPIAFAEAVEALSHLADLEADKAVAMVNAHQRELFGVSITYHTVHWMVGKEREKAFTVAKETFQKVIHYLKAQDDPGKRTKMMKQTWLLANEASQKLKRMTAAFQSAHQIQPKRRYKKEKGTTGFNALLASAVEKPKADKKLSHVFVDLDGVIKDTEYELVLLRKPDGSRFYHPKILRNLHLLTEAKEGHTAEAPLIFSYQEMRCQQMANFILKKVWQQIDAFYLALPEYRDLEGIFNLQKMTYALMLAANVDLAKGGKKASHYLHDFQVYLRMALRSKEYHKWQSTYLDQKDSLAMAAVDLVQGALSAFFSPSFDWRQVDKALEPLLGSPKKEVASVQLGFDEKALLELMKDRSYGPIAKTLRALLHQESRFDPLFQQFLPAQQYDLYIDAKKITFFNLPTPTGQDSIDSADISPEWSALLHRQEAAASLLLFNFQDRSSWKEHARSAALEQLDVPHLNVVTLAKEGDFYHQRAHYEEMNQSDFFLKVFEEHLLSGSSGYFFSSSLKGTLRGQIAPLLQAVHDVFFASRNVLTKSSRQSFIDLFYLLLEVKLIDLLKPNAVSHTCKDGLDISSIASAEMYLFLRYLQGERISKEDVRFLRTLIFAPTLMQRERVVFYDRFLRFTHVLKVLEGIEMRKALGHVIDAKWFDLKLKKPEPLL
jgi:hypothetical protein